ncbi:receptor-type tyrosine-protein phosphatase F-like [Homarus americanus]|uniref:receptor-type tyrosine-protein phosphatase F-like n=1 Tax=Homarus americanus TaxID=6706 RepID=UPI001C44FD49|nr:receptor-type tyrosine-protein phosphatase F-like [Homarus americanus]
MKILVYLLAAITVCPAQDLGHIKNLQVTSGDGSITLEWDFVAGDPTYKLHKYTILTDNDFSTDLRCPAAHCTTIIDYLDACKEHTFDVTPVFDDTVNGGSVNGDTSSISGFANAKSPSSPTNLRIVSDGDLSTTLQWDAPTQNPTCVQSYKVCYMLDKDPTPSCETTEDTTITLAGLQACGEYHVTVTPVTPSDTEGPQLEQDVTTRDGVPGPPQNVKVGVTTDSIIEVEWNDPVVNPLCVKDFSFTCGEVTSRTRFSYHLVEDDDDYDHHANIGPLKACTEYTISIKSIGKNGEESASITKNATTKEDDPHAPPYILVHPTSPVTIDVEWSNKGKERCVGYYIICWYSKLIHTETCQNVMDADGSFTITELIGCNRYDVSLTVVTPEGTHSETVRNFTNTPEDTPGPVVNLKADKVQSTSVEVSFSVPKVNLQCVGGYDIKVINFDASKDAAPRGTEGQQDIALQVTDNRIVSTVSGLNACTNYEIKVGALSLSGELTSPWEAVIERTDDLAPSEPQHFEVKEVTRNSVTFQWYQPTSNLPCLTAYKLTYKHLITTKTKIITDISNYKMEYMVDGLSHCAQYTFTLSAKSVTKESQDLQIVQHTACF